MKKFVFLILAMLFGSVFAQKEASAFYVNARTWISPGQVQAEVCNTSFDDYRSMQCSVQVVGFTNTGAPLSAWSTLQLLPGACQYAYVYVNMYGVYFVNGNAQADCRWF